jgi:hypothetical protein
MQLAKCRLGGSGTLALCFELVLRFFYLPLH